MQAPMATTHLPGKVLQLLGGCSVLERMVRAVRDSAELDGLVVVTTTGSGDDAVATECARLGVAVHRGPAGDPLRQVVGALDDHPADAVMPFSTDCPLLDPELIAVGVRVFRAMPGLDYLSTALPRTLPQGMDIEVVRASTLRAVDSLAAGEDRAELTGYLRDHLDDYRVVGLTVPPRRAHLRLTLDTMEDFALISMVVSHFGDSRVSVTKVVEWLDANPAVRALNAKVA
ncbi:cytidylyltransferase domain-containing protein [Pilimelia columellifera]